MTPGRALHRFASRICSSTTLERVVEPAIADLQKECAEAGLRSPLRRAAVLVLGYACVWEGIAMTALEMSPRVESDRRALMRAFIWAAVVTVCVSALLVALTIAATPVFAPFYIALLTPMALPVALPIGLTLGLAFGFQHQGVSRPVRKIVLVSAVLITAISFTSMAYVKPVANQSFRQAIFNAIGGQGVVIKGLNEMSLSELQREASMVPRGDANEMPQRASWIYHLTFALPVAPLVLGVLALTLLARGTRRATVIAICVVYYVLLISAEALVYEGLPPAAAAWLPNLAGIASAIVIASSSSSRLRGSLRPAH